MSIWNHTRRSAGLLGTITVAAAAPLSFATGPHHFQEWFQGEIVALDPTTHSFTVRPSKAGEPAKFVWDAKTDLFASGAKHGAHSKLMDQPPPLQPGEKVRVLYQAHGQERQVIRILCEPSAGQANRK
jgi:hypothetical protein